MFKQQQELLEAASEEMVTAVESASQAFPKDPAEVIGAGIKLAFEQMNKAGQIISAAALAGRYPMLRANIIAAAGWIVGQSFIPLVGKNYEVSFGTVPYQGTTGNWTAKIRVDGLQTALWIDLDTNAPIDPELAKWAVQAFRQI